MKKILSGPLSILIVLTISTGMNGQQARIAEGINPGSKIFPTGEFQINPEKIYNAAPFDQVNPSIAFNGSVYLVVWAETRTNFDMDIFGARLDVSGNLLDPAGIVISKAGYIQKNPVVASNGDIFMVAWEDDRNSDGSGTNIYGSRVDAQGNVLDPGGFSISTAQDLQIIPAIGSAEGNFFVAWADRRSGTNYDIYGSFISNTGSVANPEGLAICTLTSWQYSPAIGYDGARYFIIWTDQRGFSKDIYGTFLKTDGTLSHANGTGLVTLFNNQENPSLVWGGTQYFLVWEENQSGSPTSIHGARVSTSGALLDVNGIPIASSDDKECFLPSVASMDNEFIVAYVFNSNSDIYDGIVKRIGPDGTILDADGIVFNSGNPNFQNPALAFSGSNTMIGWMKGDNTLDIYGTRVESSGTILDPNGILISQAYNAQLNTDLAFDGLNYLAVWTDTRNGNFESIYAARINDGGTVLDAQAIEIAMGDEISGATSPSVAFNGENYLVAWMEQGGIYGTRVSTQGVRLDNPFKICDETGFQLYPDVASDGSNWLVAWIDQRNTGWDIYGAIVTATGSVLHPQGFSICSADQDQIDPDIVFAGNQYVVIWSDFRSGSVTNIYGGRVSTDGNVLDGDGLALATDNEIMMLYPSVAYDGTNLMACWQSGLPGNYDIYGIRFDQAMNVLDAQPFAVSTSLRDQLHVSLAFNGEQYMAAWMDLTTLLHFRIGMAKINVDGTIAENGILSELEGDLIYPAIVHGPLKQVLTSFSAFMTSIDGNPVNTMRALGLLIGQGQGPGIEERQNSIIHKISVYPNPVHETAVAEYELLQKAHIRISIIDLTGKTIQVVLNREQTKGSHQADLNLQLLPEGIYFMKIEAGSFATSQKIVISQN